MEEFKIRLIEEFKELDERCSKLNIFIDENKKYKELSEEQQILMSEQLQYMLGYLKCLYKRINLTISVKELDEYDKIKKG